MYIYKAIFDVYIHRRPTGSSQEAHRKPLGSPQEAHMKATGSQQEAHEMPIGSQQEAHRKPTGSSQEANRKLKIKSLPALAEDAKRIIVTVFAAAITYFLHRECVHPLRIYTSKIASCFLCMFLCF